MIRIFHSNFLRFVLFFVLSNKRVDFVMTYFNLEFQLLQLPTQT